MVAESSQIHNLKQPNLELIKQITSINWLQQPTTSEATSQFPKTAQILRCCEGARCNRWGKEREPMERGEGEPTGGEICGFNEASDMCVLCEWGKLCVLCAWRLSPQLEFIVST